MDSFGTSYISPVYKDIFNLSNQCRKYLFIHYSFELYRHRPRLM